MDAFDVLGIAAKFELSEDELGRAYLRAVARAHPDVGDTDHDATSFDEAAGRINEARAVLRDPEQRAATLLKRLGGPGPEDRTLPPGFLMEMMEIREEIESAIANATGSAGDLVRSHWRQWAGARRAAHIEAVSAHFRALQPTGDAMVPDPGASGAELSRATRLRAIRTELNAWRYAERLIEQLAPAPGSPGGLPRDAGTA
jgi:curved DNA-binding protein CbpA